MCGRYSFFTSKEKLQEQFGQLSFEEPLKCNYNIAPTQRAYVVTNDAPGQLQEFRWGLCPFWSKEGRPNARMINARAEGIENKPSYRQPIRKRRCWVLADSFYEWKTEGKVKAPYRILDPGGRLLVLAGIWETWRQEETPPLHTFSIITTAPNAEMAAVHDRMPAILYHREMQEQWLDDLDLTQVLSLLEPPPDHLLKLYRISSEVNSVRNNGPSLHDPVPEE